MKILAVETSSKVCSVALAEDDKLIKEEILEDENTHSVKLMPLIDKLLSETNNKLEDVDLFAVDKGPGSFTGIRIGIATIKAFVDVTNKKGIGITSLETLAYNVKEDSIICSLIDAKNENVYCGLFERTLNKISQLEELEFNNIDTFIEKVKIRNEKIVFVGDGALNHKDRIKENLKENAMFINDENLNKLNARNICLAAFNNNENSGDSNSLIPSYLRKSNAERLSLKR